MDVLRKQIEEDTGFVCYENGNMIGAQIAFFGTSDKLDDFKTLAGTHFPTGTIAYCMDAGTKYMYSAYKNSWYEL